MGYIIGPRIASIMAAGGVLSYLVLIPAIKFFGSGWTVPLAPETANLIRDMDVAQIQKAYILYIGAGAVAAGGIISLVRSLPLIWGGLKGGLADLRMTRASAAGALRTDRDTEPASEHSAWCHGFGPRLHLVVRTTFFSP